MQELINQALPFVGPALVPLFVIMLAPMLQKRGRTFLAALMSLVAAGFLVDIVVIDHGHMLTLDVPSVFGRGENADLHVWTMETVEAPAWHWHIVASIYYAIAALLALLGRGRPSKAPGPIITAFLLFLLVLLVRMGMEKTAAHVGIVWALGTSWAGLLISLFFGYYCGARGMGFGGFVKSFAVANVLQRAAFCLLSWFATANEWGTHLDVTALTEISAPLIGPMTLETPTQAWLYGILMPQMTFALAMSIVVGVVLGALPFAFGRRLASKG